MAQVLEWRTAGMAGCQNGVVPKWQGETRAPEEGLERPEVARRLECWNGGEGPEGQDH